LTRGNERTHERLPKEGAGPASGQNKRDDHQQTTGLNIIWFFAGNRKGTVGWEKGQGGQKDHPGGRDCLKSDNGKLQEKLKLAQNGLQF